MRKGASLHFLSTMKTHSNPFVLYHFVYLRTKLDEKKKLTAKIVKHENTVSISFASGVIIIHVELHHFFSVIT